VILPLYIIIGMLLLQTQELKPLRKLSDYGFFAGNLADLRPVDGVVPYDLNTALYSNNALKARFVKVPPETKAVYNDSIAFSFPVGTYLIKNFFYYNDDRDSSKGRRIVETRLLVRTGDEWEGWPYIWNEEQTEAVYDVAGERFEIEHTNGRGRKELIGYRTPNKNECKGCHSRNGKLVPLGPTARNLNSLHTVSDQLMESYLKTWQRVGILKGDITASPALPQDWNQKYSLDDRARAYLDVNCGNCHSRQGPASTSGLFLDWKETDPAHIGVWKSPVAAGRGSGDFSYDIEPGKPGRSILLYRMKVLDPGIAMPEIGREQVDEAGVRLIEDWIKAMKYNSHIK
jgi:uncharacterized repeat protein (TIGR03806 family)